MRCRWLLGSAAKGRRGDVTDVSGPTDTPPDRQRRVRNPAQAAKGRTAWPLPSLVPTVAGGRKGAENLLIFPTTVLLTVVGGC